MKVSEAIKLKVSLKLPVKLSKKQKIELLKRAKEIYQERYIGKHGICLSVGSAFRELIGEDEDYITPMKYVELVHKLHNIDYLSKLAPIFGFKAPSNNWFWWDLDDSESRLKVFDALISKLENA